MKKISVFLVVLISMTPVYAQRFQTGTHLILGLPQQDFKDNVENTGYGLGGIFLSGIRRMPLMIGVKIDYLILGSTRHKAVSGENEITVKSTSNALLAHFITRVQRYRGSLRPYAEALIGLTSITKQLTSTRNISPTLSFGLTGDETDLAFSYGLGAGAQIALRKPSRTEYFSGFSRRGMYLDLRINYLFGGNVEFLKKNSLQIGEGTVTFEETKTKTNLLAIYLGLVFGM